MKCACGRELSTSDLNGMCSECFNNQNKADYCRIENLPTGWICPKCGYVWAIWVNWCSNCNVPKYEIKTTDGTDNADKIKP